MSELLVDVCEQLAMAKVVHIDRSAANESSSSSTPTTNCSSAIFSFAFLTQFLYCSSETGPSTAISFCFSVLAMNLDENEFFPSNEI